MSKNSKSYRYEPSPVVEMQDEDRRIGRGCVELVDGGQPLLRELVLGEAADHTQPLRTRSRASVYFPETLCAPFLREH